MAPRHHGRRRGPGVEPLSNVERLPTHVLQCSHCACQSFYCYASGDTECAGCGSMGSSGDPGAWAMLYKPSATKTADAEVAASRQHYGGDGEAVCLARDVVIRRATTEDPSTLAGLILVRNDGSFSAWPGTLATNKAQRRWWKRKFASILQAAYRKSK